METKALNWMYRGTVWLSLSVLLSITYVTAVVHSGYVVVLDNTDMALTAAALVVGFATGHSSKK